MYTYPESLSKVLDEVGYKREAIPKGEGFFAQPSTLLSDILLTEKKRTEVALLLMQKNDWDLLFCMLSSTDRILHHVGSHFTPKDLQKNLITMDEILGEVMERLPKGSFLLVVSDHGFTL